MEQIVTHYWPTPIPDRRFDWSAVTVNYEGGDGYDERPSPIGHGRTEADAIDDLIIQIRED